MTGRPVAEAPHLRVALDAMGGDHGPAVTVAGAVLARARGVDVVLVGEPAALRAAMHAHPGAEAIEVVAATEVIGMHEDPAVALRSKRDASIRVAAGLVAAGGAGALVSTGSTGATLAAALLAIGRLSGVRRPAVAAVLPTGPILIDAGASPDVQPDALLAYAAMGGAYAEVRGVVDPRVGLLNVGEEPGKGNAAAKAAFAALGAHPGFVGNVEPAAVLDGAIDVVVTDGFTGNILLKSSEAVAKLITDTIRQELMGSFRTKMGGLLAKPAFGKIRQMMDPAEVGAVPLLGLDGLVFVGHGRSDARALINGIRVARQAVEAGLLPALRSAIQEKLVEPGTMEAS
jgi:phosphate acyltransferase